MTVTKHQQKVLKTLNEVSKKRVVEPTEQELNRLLQSEDGMISANINMTADLYGRLKAHLSSPGGRYWTWDTFLEQAVITALRERGET